MEYCIVFTGEQLWILLSPSSGLFSQRRVKFSTLKIDTGLLPTVGKYLPSTERNVAEELNSNC